MYYRLHDRLAASRFWRLAVLMEVLRAPFVLGLRDGLEVWLYIVRQEVL